MDEGKRLKVYFDSRRNPTVGVGHLVRFQDHLKVGDVITEAQCQAFLDEDIAIAVEIAHKVFPDFDELPEEAQLVLANMAYNLGEIRLRGFTLMCEAVANRAWTRVAAQMRASLWARQVG